jgi:hypothetical protein
MHLDFMNSNAPAVIAFYPPETTQEGIDSSA